MPWTVNPDHGYLERFENGSSIGAVMEFNVDGNTPPGTDPVVPDGSGIVTLTGAQVSSGTVGANVLRSYSLAANSITYQIQQAGAAAAEDTTLNGVAHFNSAEFTVSNGFVSLLGGGAGIDSIGVDLATGTGTDPVVPDGAGMIDITGGQAAAGTVPNVIQTHSTAPNSFIIEIQKTSSSAISNPALNGGAHFNSAEFSVDGDGFVSLAGGGLAIDSVALQTGTTPIVPTGAGLITFNGSSVAAGTNPVRTNGTGANTMQLEVQISQAIAATDATKIGLANFDSAAFDVDANGFVQLNGGGIATTSFDVQSNTAPGTDPVLPSGTGVVTVNGAAVANHSVVLETHSRAANAFNIEVQYATSAAATDATKSGVAHFDSTDFTVDANGFVALAGAGAGQTITGDSGGALAPTLGNWNILGLSGSKTSGSGSTLTVKSPPYSDQAAGTTVTLNSGSFATNAITLTLPLTAGLADGDLCEFVATNGVLVIQCSGTQVGHLGNVSTSAGGTFTGTSTGDSLSLRYQASTDDWWATSSIGNWILA